MESWAGAWSKAMYVQTYCPLPVYYYLSCFLAVTMCAADVTAGVPWDPVPPGMVLRRPCSSVNLQLKGSVSMVKRTCSQEGVWGELDFSQCTLAPRTNPFLLVWLVVQSDSVMEVGAMSTQLEQAVRYRHVLNQ